MIEYRDLYDKDRHLTGKVIEKDKKPPEGNYILIVIVFMRNSKGEYLIQKRSVSKGGKWATTGGHAKTGETSIEAIKTEISEELGLNINTGDLFLYNSIRDEYTQAFWDFYSIDYEFNLDKIILQDEEVDDVMIATKDEILKMIDNDEFHKGHGIFFKEYLEYLNNEKI